MVASIGRSCWGHSGNQKSCALARSSANASAPSGHCQSTAQARDGQIWFLKKCQSLGFACRLLTFYFWFKLKPNKHCCWRQIKWPSCLRLLSRPLLWPFARAARWKWCRQKGSPGKWERKIETLVKDLVDRVADSQWIHRVRKSSTMTMTKACLQYKTSDESRPSCPLSPWLQSFHKTGERA